MLSQAMRIGIVSQGLVVGVVRKVTTTVDTYHDYICPRHLPNRGQPKRGEKVTLGHIHHLKNLGNLPPLR